MTTKSAQLYKEATSKSKWWKLNNSKRKSIKLYLQAADTAFKEHDDTNELKAYKKAAKMLKKVNDKQNLASCYLMIGHLKWSMLNQYTSALKYYTRSLDIYTELNSKEHIAFVLKTIAAMYETKSMKYNNVLSQIYYKNLDINKAIYMYQQALLYYKELNDDYESNDCIQKINDLSSFFDKYKKKTVRTSSSLESYTNSNSTPPSTPSQLQSEQEVEYNGYECDNESELDLSEIIASQFAL